MYLGAIKPKKNHTKSDGLKSNLFGGNTVHLYLKPCCK